MDWEAFYGAFRQPDFLPGFEIQNRLGGGAFGDVYKAKKLSIGKIYAVKFLKVEDEGQREVVQRELEQIRHFAAIDHPNLVTVEDMGLLMGAPYILMGYAGEDTLARRLKRSRLSSREALSFFVQTCRGVLALHDMRLVHFDIKPSNVFLKGDVARLGDYGLSKLMVDGRRTLSFGRGTPSYMAPEIFRKQADHRADIYSLGALFFESLCGHPPFVDPSAKGGDLMLRDEDEPLKFPPELDGQFPDAWRSVIERCLSTSPDDRFAAVSQILESLGQTGRPGQAVVRSAAELANANQPELSAEQPARGELEAVLQVPEGTPDRTPEAVARRAGQAERGRESVAETKKRRALEAAKLAWAERRATEPTPGPGAGQTGSSEPVILAPELQAFGAGVELPGLSDLPLNPDPQQSSHIQSLASEGSSHSSRTGSSRPASARGLAEALRAVHESEQREGSRMEDASNKWSSSVVSGVADGGRMVKHAVKETAEVGQGLARMVATLLLFLAVAGGLLLILLRLLNGVWPWFS